LLGISSKLKTRGETGELWTLADLVLEPIGYVLLGTRVMRDKEAEKTAEKAVEKAADKAERVAERAAERVLDSKMPQEVTVTLKEEKQEPKP